MLDRVQIPQSRRRYDAYPHELSGGMRQRAMIALALACKPRLLLADEPTTALDASVQIQILLLLRELQKETGMSVIFVTHDIGAAVEVADKIAVMYGGRIVEENTVKGIVTTPRHPYTAGLLASTVSHENRGQPLPAVRGAPPNLAALPPGCSFAPRCDHASERCVTEKPAIVFCRWRAPSLLESAHAAERRQAAGRGRAGDLKSSRWINRQRCSRAIARASITTGTIAISTMVSAGKAASPSLSSDAS
jgi:oligopeptide/dipeptide ABC transporter ATP-binding protein